MIMEDYKLLLPTSGVGSRLDDLTKYTNKSLIRVGKKPVISYIIEKYPDNIEIVVTLGYYGDQVKNFLELAYPTRHFTFVTVDIYEGIGSSLLYSMLCAKPHLQCPFIFHACDAITFDAIPRPNSNWCAAFNINEKNSQYRTHNVAGEQIIKINEHGESHFDRIHIGICGIKDYIEFWDESESIYNFDINNNQLSDCHTINALICKKIHFNSLTFKTWLDIGNTESLLNARRNIYDQFNILDKVDESIFILKDSVIKFFYNNIIAENRVERSKRLQGIVPKITGTTKNFYKYDYANGVPLSISINIIKFGELLKWSMAKLWTPLSNSNEAYDRCKDFYFAKTKSRIKKFLLDSNIEDTIHTINGIRVPTAIEMLNSIDASTLCTPQTFNFHGDFILNNIIDNENGDFTLIDWRQDFGGSLDGGDIYYDFAKLNHSLILDHDIVNRGLFNIMFSDNNIKCDIMRNSITVECQHILYEFLVKHNFSLPKVNLLTPIIWLNMSPMHEYPINTFLFFFGKYSLAKVLYKL